MQSAKILGEESRRKVVWTQFEGQPLPAVYRHRREFRPLDVSTEKKKVGVLSFLIIKITETSVSPLAGSEIMLGRRSPGGGR